MELEDTCAAALTAAEQARTAGDHQAGVEAARKAVAAAAACGDPRLRVHAQQLLALHLWGNRAPDQAVDVALSALREADALGMPERAIDLRLTLVMSELALGLPSDALLHAMEAVDRAGALRQPGLLSWSLNRLAVVYDVLGHGERGIELLRQAVQEAERDGGAEVRLAAHFNLASMLVSDIVSGRDDVPPEAVRERASQGLDAVRQAARLAGEHSKHQVLCVCEECVLLIRLGRADELDDAVERLSTWVARSGLTGYASTVAIFRGHALFVRGQTEAAYRVLNTTVRREDLTGDPADMNWWLDGLHRVCRASGRFEQAMQVLEEWMALERARARQHNAVQWKGLLRQAEMRTARLEADRLRQEAANFERQALEASNAALRDALTGLANRRALDGSLTAWLQRSGADTAWHVAMLDIDHFKAINDAWGHDVGDQVLQQVGRLLSAMAGPADVVARNGGEEFAALLAGGDAAAAQAWCGTLRLAIERQFWAALGPGGQVTVSIGLTAARAGDDRASLMRRADQAMYRAKNEGRNRLVLA